MPSKPKLWFVADEDERFKVFRYEHPEKADLWVEIRYNKARQRWTRVRTAWTDWRPLGQEPIRNHAVAKRQAFLFLLETAFEVSS